MAAQIIGAQLRAIGKPLVQESLKTMLRLTQGLELHCIEVFILGHKFGEVFLL